MTTLFKKVNWDSDVSENYQEFKKSSKESKNRHKKKKLIQNLVEKIETSKTAVKVGTKIKAIEKRKKNIKKSERNLNSAPVIESTETLTKSKKKRLKRLRKLKIQNTINDNNKKHENVVIKSKKNVGKDISGDDQEKLLEKYHTELSDISIHAQRMRSELKKEKTRKKRWKAKLKAMNQNQIHTDDMRTRLKDDKDESKKPKNENGKRGKMNFRQVKYKTKESVDEDDIISTDTNGVKSKNYKFFEKSKDIPNVSKDKKPILSLRQRMMQKLKAARFRFLNEEIYTSDGKAAQRKFQSDPEAFKAYHDGYRQQVKKWPLNPLDNIIKSIQKMPKTLRVADMGCGDARLSRSIPQEVFSFDLVAVNDSVTACDMSKLPLEDGVIDVAVFCLSLMGTNLSDYLIEAQRIMKNDGILKIAEVESRFEDVDKFITDLQKYGFRNTFKDLSHNLFYFLDFRKQSNIRNKKILPKLTLLPCLYKKR